MTLAPGTRIGPYEITAKLGEGGMGEVWRATDTRLRREVAIKVLPAAVTADRERLARFEREAQLLAQLQHPNIAAIHGVEETDGTNGAIALVMELVEGEDLAARLARGRLPVEEALAIARQIADALEAAHEKGIIHRDLKPANVKLAADGRVKVLDFGLAKALDTVSGSAADLARSPTLLNSPTLSAAPGTLLGVILGTAAYMAPEQAAGGAVDRRADIWSFGVVLWEMLTGRRLFEGETVSHVLAGVLKDTPDLSALPAETPPSIVALVERCLRRKPRERLQAIGEARVVLEEALAAPPRDTSAPARTTDRVDERRPSRMATILAVVASLAAIAFAVLWLRGAGDTHQLRGVQAELAAPEGWGFGDNFAVSPDGRHVAFSAFERETGAVALWLRTLDSGESRRLPSTDGAEMPFWSPDGTHLAFFADGKLQRVDLRGGPAQTLCDAPSPRGGAWGPDGTIAFAPAFRTGLSIVSATGGEARELTTLDEARHEKSHRFPVFLPGGKTILFVAQTAEGGTRDDTSGIEALEIATAKRTRLVAANSSPRFAPPGEILFWRDGALLAQRFDVSQLTLEGEPRRVASPVAFTQNEQALADVSSDGTLVYRAGDRGSFSTLALFDRGGTALRVLRDSELITDYFALSHDGRRLVYAMNSPGQGSSDLWIVDPAGGAASRLTFEEGSEDNPVWSADDRYVYYSNDRRNDGAIYRRATDGTGTPEEIGTTDSGIQPFAASRDGSWLVVRTNSAAGGFDISRFDLATDALTPLVANPSHDEDGALSPDDRLLAYAAETSGVWQINVQTIGGTRGQWQVSTDGGMTPRWRADGRELFWFNRPDRLMAVDVEPGPVPRFSAPHEIFRQAISSFDVSPDGQQFVVLRGADTDANRALTLVTHWPRLLAEAPR